MRVEESVYKVLKSTSSEPTFMCEVTTAGTKGSRSRPRQMTMRCRKLRKPTKKNGDGAAKLRTGGRT